MSYYSDLELIKESNLFDEKWYYGQYPDVCVLRLDAAEHYLRFGADMGRDPSPLFDTKAYRTAYPDIFATPTNPLVHYLRFGRHEGRLPLANGPPDAVAGAAGEPSEATTHVGAILSGAIDRAATLRKQTGVSRVYDTVATELDTGYYLARYRDILLGAKVDPVQHYINAGAREGRAPNPNFDTKAYVERYPEVRETKVNPLFHWASKGRQEGYICEPFKDFEEFSDSLGVPALEAQAQLHEWRTDVHQRLHTGGLGEMVRKAAMLEPLINHSWTAAMNAKFAPFHSDAMVAQIVGLSRLFELAEHRQAKAVIIVNRPRWGSGLREEGHIAHRMAEVYGEENVVFMVVDGGGPAPDGKIPDGSRYVDFATATQGRDREARQLLLAQFLRSLKPDAVFAINSLLFWETLGRYGKALAQATRLMPMFLCNDRNYLGHPVGYPMRNFYRYFDMCATICTDSHALAEELIDTYMVPESRQHKITVLEGPVDPNIAVAQQPARSRASRPQIFWASRFDRQKRVDVVYEIARLMPHCDIRMWGESFMDDSASKLEKPENVSHEGKYAEFSDLPFDDCDLWLYTSEWDGVPIILLEVAMTGVPIVGSLVGGTGEVLRPDFTWPVKAFDQAEPYQAAIEEILADPDAARTKARALRDVLLQERNADTYRETLKTLLPRSPSVARQPVVMS